MSSRDGRPRCWFHVDMDAFFAAVEQRDHPEYRGKPLIIGGDPASRGVVSTASYEARKFGVHSAMPTSQAYRLCPHGIFIHPRMEAYSRESAIIMKLFDDFSPTVIPVSIDEAFIDMTGTDRIFGPPRSAGELLKQRVRERTGLTITVGIAANKLIAKIASGMRKPDGLTEVPPGTEEEFVGSLDLAHLWGVGKKTQERLSELNITSIAMLRQIPEPTLRALFGQAGGAYLYQVCRGIDPGIYSGQSKSRSISNERTFGADITHRGTLEQVLLELSHSILFRLLEEKLESRVVVLKIRYSDFTTSTVQCRLKHPVRSVEETHETALKLLAKRWNGSEPVRLIGLGFAQVEKDAGAYQGELFADTEIDLKRKRVEKAVLGIRSKYSTKIIQKGSLMEDRQTDRRGRNPERTGESDRKTPKGD